jgi:hypothetical protein
MIFKTAYETTACVGYRLDKTYTSLKAAFYNNETTLIPSYNIYSLIGGGAFSNDVPAFAHPLLVNIDKEVPSLFIDSRSFGKYDTDNREFKIRNEVEYSLLLARAKLNTIWLDGKEPWLRDVSTTPIAMFASWISESVGRRFALDPKEQFDLGILAAIFYTSQFSDSVELDERDKLRMVNSITRALRAPAQDVIEILDKVSIINNVFEFCGKAEEVTNSVRLKDLNPGVLYTILGGTWFGVNAKEMLAVAVEHPPTWIAILLSAFTERTFRNSQISKIAERSSFKKAGEDFVRATLNMLRVNED